MDLPASRGTWKDLLLLPWTYKICSVLPSWTVGFFWWDAASFWPLPSSLARWKKGKLIILRAVVLREQRFDGSAWCWQRLELFKMEPACWPSTLGLLGSLDVWGPSSRWLSSVTLGTLCRGGIRLTKRTGEPEWPSYGWLLIAAGTAWMSRGVGAALASPVCQAGAELSSSFVLRAWWVSALYLHGEGSSLAGPHKQVWVLAECPHHWLSEEQVLSLPRTQETFEFMETQDYIHQCNTMQFNFQKYNQVGGKIKFWSIYFLLT